MMTQSRWAIVAGGFVVALTAALFHGELVSAPSSTTHIESQPLAARYHLRKRTSDFYSRARPGASPYAPPKSR